jgi:hypothetical protein
VDWHCYGHVETSTLAGSWQLGLAPSPGDLLLSVQVYDSWDEALLGRGSGCHLVLRGGQFPVFYRLGHQAFPGPSLLKLIQSGFQSLLVPKVGWFGPGSQTHQTTWRRGGEAQVSWVSVGASTSRPVSAWEVSCSSFQVWATLLPPPWLWCSVFPPPGIPLVSSAW